MISVPGIGSGLDINSIVTSLVAAEGDAKTLLLATQRSDTEFEISAFGALKSTLSNFSSSLSFLKSETNFQSNTLLSSDTATTDGSLRTIPCPGTNTRMFVVPRSIPTFGVKLLNISMHNSTSFPQIYNLFLI